MTDAVNKVPIGQLEAIEKIIGEKTDTVKGDLLSLYQSEIVNGNIEATDENKVDDQLRDYMAQVVLRGDCVIVPTRRCPCNYSCFTGDCCIS